MVQRWPKSDELYCGCRVALKREGSKEVLMYFPCGPECSTVDLVKNECEKAGKPWESRDVNNN